MTSSWRRRRGSSTRSRCDGPLAWLARWPLIASSPPAQAGRSKRKQVMASAVVVPDDWAPPVVPKAKEQTDFIKEVRWLESANLIN